MHYFLLNLSAEKFIQKCDKWGCERILNNDNGVGIGRQVDNTKCNLLFKNSESHCSK